jgi:hypothetical protein
MLRIPGSWPRSEAEPKNALTRHHNAISAQPRKQMTMSTMPKGCAAICPIAPA